VCEAIKRFLLKYKTRIGIMGLGHTCVSLLNHSFDFILYPIVIWKAGLVNGVAIMTILAFMSDLAVIYFYDKTKKDWLGIETLKRVEESITSRPVTVVFNWVRNRGDMITASALSFLIDPLLIVLYMRYGSNKYNGLNRRDWKIFLTATVIGNLYWATLIFLGLESVDYLLRVEMPT